MKYTLAIILITAFELHASENINPSNPQSFFNMNPQPSQLNTNQWETEPPSVNLQEEIKQNNPQLSYNKFEVRDIQPVPPKPGRNQTRGRYTNTFQENDIPSGPPEPGRIYFNPSYNDVFNRSSIQQVAPIPGGGSMSVNPYEEPLNENNIQYTPPTPGDSTLPPAPIQNSPYQQSSTYIPNETVALSERPAPQNNLANVIQSTPNLSIFFDTLKKAGLLGLLNSNGPFTVFAPSDHAFNKLPPDILTDLLNNPNELVKTLKFHIVPEKLSSNDLKNMKIKSENGLELNIRVTGDTIMVENGKIIDSDILATNGIIHIVDTLLKQ